MTTKEGVVCGGGRRNGNIKDPQECHKRGCVCSSAIISSMKNFIQRKLLQRRTENQEASHTLEEGLVGLKERKKGQI